MLASSMSHRLRMNSRENSGSRTVNKRNIAYTPMSVPAHGSTWSPNYGSMVYVVMYRRHHREVMVVVMVPTVRRLPTDQPMR